MSVVASNVAAGTSLSKRDATASVGAVFATIADAHACGKTVTIAISRAPAFKPGKALRDAIERERA